MCNGEETMILARLLSFLALAISILIIVKLVKKALQNADLTGKIEEQENTKERLTLARQLNPELVKQQREEIKKQTEGI